MRALVVEDDAELNRFLCTALKREGFVADGAKDGKEALILADEAPYDVVLLDVVMPELDGLSVLKSLRKEGNAAAILMVTCQGHQREKLEGLNLGADDYIVKPFSITELMARIRTILRRTKPAPALRDSAVRLDAAGIHLDLLARTVEVNGKPVRLTQKEFELLEYFMRHPGQVLSQSILSQHIWKIEYETDTNFVEVQVHRLRDKINAGKRPLIEAVRGAGYRFVP